MDAGDPINHKNIGKPPSGGFSFLSEKEYRRKLLLLLKREIRFPAIFGDLSDGAGDRAGMLDGKKLKKNNS